MRFLLPSRKPPIFLFIGSFFAKAAKSTMVGSPRSTFVAPEKKINIKVGAHAWKEIAHLAAKPRLQDLSGSPKIRVVCDGSFKTTLCK